MDFSHNLAGAGRPGLTRILIVDDGSPQFAASPADQPAGAPLRGIDRQPMVRLGVCVCAKGRPGPTSSSSTSVYPTCGTGADVIRQLADLDAGPDRVCCPDVADSHDESVEAHDAGADDYVAKPFSSGRSCSPAGSAR
jgi:hypothetical protein